MEERFAVTEIPVLAGDEPGVTVTMSRVDMPEVMVAGFADPVAESAPTAAKLELWGTGGLMREKSLLLSLVLTEGFVLTTEVLFGLVEGPGAGAEPRKQLAVEPYPTMSRILVSASSAAQVASAVPMAVVLLTRATLPAVAERFGELPETSGVGSAAPVVPAVMVCTRK